jgi:predicted transposase YbfD/YdcC
MKTVAIPPLADILAEIPDVRQESGKRHPLSGMLVLAVVAMMCGYKTVNAIAEWGQNYGEKYQSSFGFERHGYPSKATWYRVLGQVDIEELERRLGGWAQECIQAAPVPSKRDGISIDGKTLRGSKKQGAEKGHLLSALTHTLGVVLGQVAVDDHTNEIGVVEDLLIQLALKGKVLTTDALLTQKKVVKQVLEQEGDYLLLVKENQQRTYQAIEDWFSEEPLRHQANPHGQITEKGHGRLTTWEIETTTQLNEYLDWPGLQQAFKITRKVIYLPSRKTSQYVRYGITSLSPEVASPTDVLTYKRNHWRIENGLHWIRDVIFDEDRSQVRCGNTHRVMAALRNLVISLLRISGYYNIVKTLRFCAARPQIAFHLVFSPP